MAGARVPAPKVQATNELANRRLSVYGLHVGQPVRFPPNGRSKRRTRTGTVLDVEGDGSLRIADNATHALRAIPFDRLMVVINR